MPEEASFRREQGCGVVAGLALPQKGLKEAARRAQTEQVYMLVIL